MSNKMGWFDHITHKLTLEACKWILSQLASCNCPLDAVLD